jgi:hypothetical protein
MLLSLLVKLLPERKLFELLANINKRITYRLHYTEDGNQRPLNVVTYGRQYGMVVLTFENVHTLN